MNDCDPINHPDHYNQGPVECIEALESIGVARDYCRGNVIKYLWRMDAKDDPLSDAKKARWYLNRLIQILENDCPLDMNRPSTDADHATDRRTNR